jgi:hypothetical protein
LPTCTERSLVSVKGIEANPDKINDIVHMKPPQSKKEVHRLTDRIAVLNRFMSRLVERSLLFFTMLRGSSSFQWGSKQHEAFNALKDHIQKLPTLASMQPNQPLILYVSTTHTAVSRDLVQEREICKENKKVSQQVPIYYSSPKPLQAPRSIIQKWKRYAIQWS